MNFIACLIGIVFLCILHLLLMVSYLAGQPNCPAEFLLGELGHHGAPALQALMFRARLELGVQKDLGTRPEGEVDDVEDKNAYGAYGNPRFYINRIRMQCRFTYVGIYYLITEK